MTAHVSPGVARRLWILGLGCGLAVPLIAVTACSQNTTPPPVVNAPPAAQDTAAGSKPQRKFNHDDPVVIDNPKIKIHRKHPDHHDDARQSGGKWSLAEMDDFTQIVVLTVDDKNAKHTVGESLSSGQTIEIYTAGGANPAFTLKWEDFGGKKHAVITEGDVTFEHEQGNRKHIKQKGAADLHIVKVTFGDTSICVADDQRPKVNDCDARPATPKELHVMLCSNDECQQTEHKEP